MNGKRKFWTAFFALLPLAGFSLLGCETGTGSAGMITDGYSIVMTEERGPYLITLWQLPEDVVIGSVQFGVELRNADTMAAVDNGSVEVYAHLPGAESQKSPAINTPRNPHFYESMLTLEETGKWDIELRWEEPLNESLFYRELVEVEERARDGDALVAGQVLFWLLLSGLILIPLFIWWRSRRWRKSNPPTGSVNPG